MSRDFQMAWSCPHLTQEEHVDLGTDRRSLDTLQPVGGAGTVRILVNNELYIPSTGLYTAAQLFSTASGPFDMSPTETVFTITTSAGTHTSTFTHTSQQRYRTDAVIKKLQRENFNIGVVENVNGHLVITDINTVGSESTVHVSGNAAAALGFGLDGTNEWQRQAIGKKLYPGWELYTRPDDIVNRFPRFLETIRGNPVFKVTYTVPVQRCRRCRATYVENDYRFAPDGNPIMVDQEDLLYQAALKILLTERGSNPYHTWYGTTIKSRIGSKAVSNVAAIISDDVRRALSRFQSLQSEQAKYQVVTTKERLYNIINIQTLPHDQDPTTFMVDVTVQNASSDPINLTIVFTVPGVVALMGSNGLFLGTEPTGLGSSRLLTGGS